MNLLANRTVVAPLLRQQSNVPDALQAASFLQADMAELARLLVDEAQRWLGDADVTVLWSLDESGGWSQHPKNALDSEQMEKIDEAVGRGQSATAADSSGDRFLVQGAGEASARAAVVVRATESQAARQNLPQDFEAFFASMRPYLACALEKAHLRESVERLERSEKLQRALFAIADMASSELDMPEMLSGLHQIVGSLMYAENFYIALFDAQTDTIRFLYFADVADDDKPESSQTFPLSQFEEGLTWHLIRGGHPLMGGHEQLVRQVSGPLRTRGPRSFDWLGVPMTRSNQLCGVLVVQSYVERPRYTQEDQALLLFVGNHILTALDRKRAHEQLELHVEQRTRELAKANEVLTVEAKVRQRGEHLQRALYRIAELSHTAGSMDDFYHAVHQVIGELINATNFYIALLSPEEGMLHFPYFVDMVETERSATRKLGSGATEYVLRTGKALLADIEDIERLHAQGDIELLGPSPKSWLGVPLMLGDKAVGVVVVQSYLPQVRYGTGDLELLTFVSYQLASSLERKRTAEVLVNANAALEQRVAHRTQELREQIGVRQEIELALQQRNAELEALNRTLAGTQSQLLQSEKMASVGQLAAGVAHEINNPIGYVHSNLTSLRVYLSDIFSILDAYERVERTLPANSSHLNSIRSLKQQIDLPYVRSDIANLFAESVEGVARVEKIVRDLKDFSHVDEAEWQSADINAGLDITLNVARHELKYKADVIKHYGVLPKIECLPSQLNQVFLNILVNAAQAIESRGTITIRTSDEPDAAVVEISDSGKGIDPAHVNRIFDPFFTTKPVGVGTGLGLSVSYGIIQKHGGTIQAHSEVGQGTTFTIRIPKTRRKNVDTTTAA